MAQIKEQRQAAAKAQEAQQKAAESIADAAM